MNSHTDQLAGGDTDGSGPSGASNAASEALPGGTVKQVSDGRDGRGVPVGDAGMGGQAGHQHLRPAAGGVTAPLANPFVLV